MAFNDNPHRTLQILEDLIQIESVNPHFSSDARGEGEVADYVEQRCKKAGLSVRRQQVFPGRENIIAELRVGKPSNALLFEAHMDTVSLGSMRNPLVPTYDGDRLYARGACDTKGSLAAMIYALEECVKHADQLSSDIILSATVDEEHAYRGLMAFLDLDIPVKGAVVGEPTDLEIVVAHKGCRRFSLTTHGVAAHSSVPQEGDNAIYQMVKVLDYIHDQVEPQLAAQHHPLCGSPTIVVGKIEGGTQVNIVPETCTVEVDRRMIPGENAEEVLQDFENDLKEYVQNKGVHLSLDELLMDWPLNTPTDASIVQSARQTASNLGLNHELQGVSYGSDASKLQQLQNTPSIVFGPGSIAQAHSKEEWVSVKAVEQAATFYVELAQTFGNSH